MGLDLIDRRGKTQKDATSVMSKQHHSVLWRITDSNRPPACKAGALAS